MGVENARGAEFVKMHSPRQRAAAHTVKNDAINFKILILNKNTVISKFNLKNCTYFVMFINL